MNKKKLKKTIIRMICVAAGFVLAWALTRGE